ncbi:LysR substrate-binding domain-containing protein [Aureimonas pseudogalii]|uniref:LysR family glycine cleavage system transcriptional activator n=1 Tax=Aureimonas pseudogalii TaxID=1744844 RepID=A0A7W6H8I3_9HYPH|nr:LysR substrate-binding domain-containing protein [Aureimonas pseudogalii]MBB4000507.1 LysR family glycine cleavage system transcriptional activator [Aureimonas pseudogalii]
MKFSGLLGGTLRERAQSGKRWFYLLCLAVLNMVMAIPLTLLETFVAVARSGRMREAALTLSLTPGAISQRVRELEELAGYRLFLRTSTGVTLSDAGQSLFATLDEPFRQIEDARRKLERPSTRRVRVSTMASFAANWLVPRLPRFTKLHPHVDIELETDSRVVDLKREPVDMAIRHGLGDYPGLAAVPLIAPELIVVASPSLLHGRAVIETPADCLAFPLLHDMDRADWRLWFEAHGVKVSAQLSGPSFSDDHLIVKAASTGQGLALVRDTYADDDLRTGRLVRPISIQWPTNFAYYAVSTAEALQRSTVTHFRNWLVSEAAADSQKS